MTILACLFTALITGIVVLTWTEHRVVEAERQRDNAVTSRDAYRSILEHRPDKPAPHPAPPSLPVNRCASYFGDKP